MGHTLPHKDKRLDIIYLHFKQSSAIYRFFYSLFYVLPGSPHRRTKTYIIQMSNTCAAEHNLKGLLIQVNDCSIGLQVVH